ncbi:MFS transporter [Microvirga pudoricolor]|uniref:MFS transporter n=1 Tax=Microvirga pudoricolor TaxID=2778729 RepID=UPI0019503FF2|nr:MFS transporter [Microvirga pudoricolor]MBM6592458.1 MFS transporter [Microvirga pudoricolor]
MSRMGRGWSAFQFVDFRLYSVSRFLAGLALQMHNVAVGWFVYDITQSAWALGLVGLVAFLPAITFALITGHVADHFDRRSIIAASHVLTALASAGLFTCAYLRIEVIWPIYVFVALIGTARAFGNPASQALVPNLVPREHFGNAIALNSSINQTATISGPALGGFLYVLGPTVVFACSAAAFAVAAILVSFISHRRADTARQKISWETLSAGLTFIRSRPVIFGAISLDLVAVLLGGAVALLPIFAQDVLGVGPWALGLLRSMPAAGALCMSFYLAHNSLPRKAGRRMLVAVAVFGLATIAFGLSKSLPLSLFCLFVLGAADMVSVFVRQTLVQSDTPDEMRGRVAAVNTIFIGASNELGEFESGALAALIGAVPAVVAGGFATLLVAGIWSKLFPALRDRDQLVIQPDGKA